MSGVMDTRWAVFFLNEEHGKVIQKCVPFQMSPFHENNRKQ